MLSGPMLFGAIADDLTGATDLAGLLVASGAHVELVVGVPDASTPAPAGADVVVVALASRTVPAADAVAWSLASWQWLATHGAERLLFKYCSTFDSTDDGNIGPVADALLDAIRASVTVAVPTYPVNGRVVRDGWLYVNGIPLDESGMRHHPRTPMTDPDLRAVLGRQTPRRVGSLGLATVRAGAEAVASHLAASSVRGITHVVVDAETDADVALVGAGCRDLRLVTGGAAIGAAWFTALAGSSPRGPGDGMPIAAMPVPAAGPGVVIAGSCSEATRRQVDTFAHRHPTVRLDVDALAAGFDPVPAVVALAASCLASGPLLIASTTDPEHLAAAQARLGPDAAAALVEHALGRLAIALRQQGVTRFVVAGGETSGAVLAALGVDSLHVGPAVDPGVPVCVAGGGDAIGLVLKSGNFGADDLFERALAAFDGPSATSPRTEPPS